MEQNYRSTGNILKTASSIISENTERIGKKLWTSDKDGNPVLIRNFEDDDFEAIFIALKNLKKHFLHRLNVEISMIFTGDSIS